MLFTHRVRQLVAGLATDERASCGAAADCSVSVTFNCDGLAAQPPHPLPHLVVAGMPFTVVASGLTCSRTV